MPASRRTKDRDQYALSLRARGLSLRAIARQLGVTTPAVHQMINRALMANSALGFDMQQPLTVEKLDALENELWRIIHGRHYIVTPAGGLVHGPDGELLTDPSPAIQAAGVLLKTIERRARMLGLDAPSRKIVFTPELVDAEIRRLEAQIEDARRNGLLDPPPPTRAIEGRAEELPPEPD